MRRHSLVSVLEIGTVIAMRAALAPEPAPPVTLLPPFIPSTSQVFAPTVTVEEIPALILEPPFIASTAQVFAPSLLVEALPEVITLEPPFIESTSQVFAPTVMLEGETPPFSPDQIAGLQSWYRADVGVYSQSAAQFVTANAEQLSIPTNASLRFGTATPWSFGGWFYLDNAGLVQVLMGKTESPTTIDWQVYLNSGLMVFNIFGGGTYPAVNLGGVTAGAWHFFLATYDPGGAGLMEMQYDAGGVGVNAAAGVMTDSALGGVQLGCNGWSGPAAHLSGRLQNCFMFARKLSPADYAFLYNSGNGRSYEELDATFKTDLRAWWPLDEVSGSRLDKSGNDNTLTDVNTVGVADGLVLNPASNNAPVYQWEDQGPAALHLSQSVMTARPTYVADGRNGHPVLDFNLSYLASPVVTTAELPVAADAGDLWVVGEHTGGGNAYLVNWNPDGVHQYILINLGGIWYYDHGPWSYSRISGAAPLTWGVMEAYRAGTVMEIWRNNTTVGAYSYAAQPLPALSDTFDVGNHSVGGADPWNGPVGEIATYNVGLPAADRAALRDYYNAKFALGF